jgi:hypothetical protein
VALPLKTGNSSFDLKVPIKERTEERVDILWELTEINGSNTWFDT